MQDRDPKTLLEELRNVDVKLPLHQTVLRKRLLDAHAEQISPRRQLLTKGAFRGFVPAVGMIAALIGLAILGAIWFLSSGRPAPGQKLIISTTTDTTTTGSPGAATGGGGCASSVCSVSTSNQEGKKSDVEQKVGGVVDSASRQGTVAVLGNAVIDTHTSQSATNTSSSPPASQPAPQPPAQNPSPRPAVAITIPVSVVADTMLPGNSGKDKQAKKEEKALSKALKHAGL